MRSNRIFISVLLVFLFFIPTTVISQINYGTTGLMNMPTADMQRDKTFMVGGNWLNHHATVPRWWYDTWNYYINITIFPWLEAGYLCTGHKAVLVDYGNRSGYWVGYRVIIIMVCFILDRPPIRLGGVIWRNI